MGGIAAADRVAVERRGRSAWLGAIARSRLSVRAHVVGLILAIVAPMLAFSAFLVLRTSSNEEDFMAATVRARSHEAAATLDHDLGSLRTRLFMLAASHSLQVGDLPAFRAQAIAAVQPDGMSLVLADPSGQEVINTRASQDVALPRTSDPDSIRRVIDLGQPDVSNLTRDAVTGEYYLA